MKKIYLSVLVALAFTFSMFAEPTGMNSPDLQVLAIVKYKGTESITLGRLKQMTKVFGPLTVPRKIEALNTMIDEILIIQAAEKAGISVTDSQVNQFFQNQLSQFVGQPVTEAQFSELLQKTQNVTLEQFIKTQFGVSLPEYKKTLKRQIIANQYIAQVKQAEIQKASAVSDDEIKRFYNNNRSTFVQPESIEMFHVIVPKGDDSAAAKKYCDELLAQVKSGKLEKKAMLADTEANAKAGNTDVKYVAQNLTVYRMDQYEQQLGMEDAEFDSLYSGNNFNTYSNVEEVADSYRFYCVLSKQEQKFLELSDVLQKGTTATVYKYIESQLSMQKQQMAILQARQEVANSLRDESSVQMVKQGKELEDLLSNW